MDLLIFIGILGIIIMSLLQTIGLVKPYVTIVTILCVFIASAGLSFRKEATVTNSDLVNVEAQDSVSYTTYDLNSVDILNNPVLRSQYEKLGSSITKEPYTTSGIVRDSYCGCKYNPDTKVIDFKSCSFTPTSNRGYIVEIEHIIPAVWLARQVGCKSRKNCDSKLFKQMSTDPLNFIMVIGEVNGERSDLPYGEIPGHITYQGCSVETDGRVFEPSDETKPVVARATLAMINKYNLKLPLHYTQLMEKWAHQ